MTAAEVAAEALPPCSALLIWGVQLCRPHFHFLAVEPLPW